MTNDHPIPEGMDAGKRARLIAFYLPQFHPIPENDEWWGEGFTEWTNVKKARPMFPGHYQPHVPGDLGYYDLRDPDVRVKQARMALAHGIEGFCYWHYWFAGRRLLEHPFNEVLASGEPDFPFCLAWANHTWSGIWHGCPDRILIEQTYPGKEDYKKHFYTLLEAFRDERYILVEGKPLFLLYHPEEIPDGQAFTDYWRELARKEGLEGIYFMAIGHELWNPSYLGCDALMPEIGGLMFLKLRGLVGRLYDKHVVPRFNIRRTRPRIHEYARAVELFRYDRERRKMPFTFYPCVMPNWDNTPRSGNNGIVLENSDPELFRIHLRDAMKQVEDRDFDRSVVFVKSWNEWAEGNYLEPGEKYGTRYLEVIREEVLTPSG